MSKEDLELELALSENDIAMDGRLQDKKQMANMFEKMVDPDFQEQIRLKKFRKQIINSRTKRVGL